MGLGNTRYFPEPTIPKSFILLWIGHTADTHQIPDELQRRRNYIAHPKPKGGRGCVLLSSRCHIGRQEGQWAEAQDPVWRAHLFRSHEQGRPQRRGRRRAQFWGLPADCHTPIDERRQEVANEDHQRAARLS